MTAPTAPRTLRVSQRTSWAITISWKPSTDNVGVTAYEVRRNGTVVATLPASATRYVDTFDVQRSWAYGYTMRARDAAGNWSVVVKTTSWPR